MEKKPKEKVLGRDMLSAQKKITYTEKYVGELIFRNVTYFFADLPLIRINFRNIGAISFPWNAQ